MGLDLSTYSGFAKYYDDLMYDVDYDDWYNFIKKISDKKYSKVLEMACGTGNLTEYIAEDPDVTTITCFDLSEDMLIEANDKLKKYPNIDILKMDMREIKFKDKKFDLAVSACDSINYILEDDDLIKVFKGAYDALEDDGVFVFDINSYYKLSETIGNNTFIDENDKVFYVWENFFDVETNICEFFITFFEKNPDGRYTRFDETHEERAYKEADIKRYLKEAGFNYIRTYYDFKMQSLSDVEMDNADRLFFVCKKGLTE